MTRHNGPDEPAASSPAASSPAASSPAATATPALAATPASPAATATATTSTKVAELIAGHRLTPVQRRIARCLVENAASAAFLSSGELARLAGVSQPSVTRFAIALGYAGYPDLRRQLRRLQDKQGKEVPESGNEYQRAVAAEAANLESLAAALADPSPIRTAAALLTDSEPLVILGQRVSEPLARYLTFLAAKFHPDVRQVTRADELEQAKNAGGTAILAVCLPRYPESTIEMLRHGKELGFKIVTITDAPIGPAGPVSDVLLPTGVGTDLVFDSHAGPAVLAVILLQAMSDISPHAADRLEAFEKLAKRLRIFTP